MEAVLVFPADSYWRGDDAQRGESDTDLNAAVPIQPVAFVRVQVADGARIDGIQRQAPVRNVPKPLLFVRSEFSTGLHCYLHWLSVDEQLYFGTIISLLTDICQ